MYIVFSVTFVVRFHCLCMCDRPFVFSRLLLHQGFPCLMLVCFQPVFQPVFSACLPAPALHNRFPFCCSVLSLLSRQHSCSKPKILPTIYIPSYLLNSLLSFLFTLFITQFSHQPVSSLFFRLLKPTQSNPNQIKSIHPV